MSYAGMPGVPDDEQPMYVQLSRTADRMMDDWRAVPRWRWLKRRRMRDTARTFHLAAANAYRRTWD